MCRLLRLSYFNSQPHKEADGELLEVFPQRVISTHSLTRRLTTVRILEVQEQEFQLTASQGG